MQDEIGAAAGAIWNVLNQKGELSLSQLKKESRCKSPVFDWGIGWLAREDKLVVSPKNKSFTVHLKGRAKAVSGG